MADDLDPLIIDLVEWCARERRSGSEVLDAWRTSCPRLTVWEDAMDRGLLVRRSEPGRGTFIDVTPKGHEFLNDHKGRVGTTAADPARHPAQPVH